MSDDHIFTAFDNMVGNEVVVSEKMDGENTSIYSDGTHARSVDSKYHPSRTWVNRIQGEIGWQLMHGERLCGENLYARHSIEYSDLDSYLNIFGYWNEDYCLSWDTTVERATGLGLSVVPVIYEGIWDEALLKALKEDILASDGSKEGYVVRLASGFNMNEFTESVAKYVRPNHVQTDQHWMFSELIPNELKKVE
jgi:hypothetical protein